MSGWSWCFELLTTATTTCCDPNKNKVDTENSTQKLIKFKRQAHTKRRDGRRSHGTITEAHYEIWIKSFFLNVIIQIIIKLSLAVRLLLTLQMAQQTSSSSSCVMLSEVEDLKVISSLIVIILISSSPLLGREFIRELIMMTEIILISDPFHTPSTSLPSPPAFVWLDDAARIKSFPLTRVANCVKLFINQRQALGITRWNINGIRYIYFTLPCYDAIVCDLGRSSKLFEGEF